MRSNRYPNSSYFTNWTSTADSITWDVDIAVSGDYRAVIYYTCPTSDVGARLELRLGGKATTEFVSSPNDPPLRGSEHDRVLRQESYVKKFAPLDLGVLRLSRGQAVLTLCALNVPGKQVADISLLTLERIANSSNSVQAANDDFAE